MGSEMCIRDSNTMAHLGAQAAQSAGRAMGLNAEQAQTLGNTVAQAPGQMSQAVSHAASGLTSGGGVPAGVNGFTPASESNVGGGLSAGQQAARAAAVAGGMAALNSMTNHSNSTMAQATGGGQGQRQQQQGAASSAMQAGARSMTRSCLLYTSPSPRDS